MRENSTHGCLAKALVQLLLVSIASMLAGRWIQHVLWLILGSSKDHSLTLRSNMTSSRALEVSSQKSAGTIFEMLFTPVGTWGIGPSFNGAVWFAAMMLPLVEYPASPVAMAPLWTALGAPVLLLAEDVYSVVNKRRRDEVTLNTLYFGATS